MVAEASDHQVEVVEGFPERCRINGDRGEELGKSWAENAGVSPRVKERDPESERGHGVSMGPRDALNESVKAQRARQDAVVERLEGDAFLGELPLHVLMAVDAELRVVRK